jgi:hypothetical protein
MRHSVRAAFEVLAIRVSTDVVTVVAMLLIFIGIPEKFVEEISLGESNQVLRTCFSSQH